MDVTSSTQSATTTPSTTTTSSSTSSINSDFDTFLKMLTAQLTNQDPLNPLDSQDFAVQLATFSSVEQQTKTNDLLTELGDRLTASGASQLANWVGREARVTADPTFDGTALTLSPEIPDTATKAELVVRTEAGREVDRRAVALDAETITWDGIDQTGATLPRDRYNFTLESVSGGDAITTSPVAHYARISEARLTPGAEKLVLDNGIAVAPENVLALRSAE